MPDIKCRNVAFYNSFNYAGFSLKTTTVYFFEETAYNELNAEIAVPLSLYVRNLNSDSW